MNMFRLFLLVLCLTGTAAFAGPDVYQVDKSTSKIEFKYYFGGAEITGKFNQYTIDLRLDFTTTSNSSVNVTLQTTSANGGFAFATQALLGASVLDAANFPTMHFRSTRFRVADQQIKIDGQITIRGITKPITLDAQMFRPAGSDLTQRDRLRIKLTGVVNRHDFGASGFPTIVGSDLVIVVDANITRAR